MSEHSWLAVYSLIVGLGFVVTLSAAFIGGYQIGYNEGRKVDKGDQNG